MIPSRSNGAHKAITGFVSTSVLTSSDGLFGDNVEEKRIVDGPPPSDQSVGDLKPLFERLQEQKDQKDKDWKEKNNPFAPPKSLDEEEIQFIRDLESRKLQSDKERKEQYADDLAQYSREHSKIMNTSSSQHTNVELQTLRQKEKIENKSKKSVVVVRKRKNQSTKNALGKKAKVSREDSNSSVNKANQKNIPTLVSYGSDASSE